MPYKECAELKVIKKDFTFCLSEELARENKETSLIIFVWNIKRSSTKNVQTELNMFAKNAPK